MTNNYTMKIDTCKKWQFCTETLGFGEYSNSKTGEMFLFSNLTEQESKSLNFDDNGRIEFKSYEDFEKWYDTNKSVLWSFHFINSI